MIHKHKVGYCSIPIGVEPRIYGEMNIYAHGIDDAKEKALDILEEKHFGRPRSEWIVECGEKERL